MNLIASAQAISSVVTKEFIHILRDRRILVLILLLPPLMTLMFGHAFEATTLTNAPALLQDRDQSPESQQFVERITKNPTFAWRQETGANLKEPDLLRDRVQAALIIPSGWGKSLANGNPKPLKMQIDGSDTTTAQQLEGAVQQALGEFQLAHRDEMIEQLPQDVMDLAQKLPAKVRKEFVSSMDPWTVQSEILYNPRQRYIDYVTPGIIGLVLQLLTVTLMACTITREREAGTLSQLMITSLRRAEIVIGKVLPYLAISIFLIASAVAVAYFHFSVRFQQPGVLAVICLLFLICSLGLGLLISAFSNSQTQAIQFAVFFLLPVFPLSGAFAPLEQLPQSIRYISQTFPLTHFCHAFRLISLQNADFSFIISDLVFLALGAFLTCGGAGLLLSRSQE
ncbi:MAG: ABC transporter permease [Chthoniobacteraceae bacterium]